MDNPLKNKKILLTGGHGFLGKHVFNKLWGINSILVPTFEECDLRIKENCEKITKDMDIVIHLAATTGGIEFNRKNPAVTFYDNASMALNLIDASYKNGVEKFVGIGSVCEYPKFTPTPFKEENLWDGYPEESNGAYGLAKKLMLVQSQAYREQYGFNAIHLLQNNLYGPGDNFDLETSHAIPALIKKIYFALKENKNYIEVWGTGKPTREFLYVEDAAEGIILATERYDKSEPVNLGSSQEISINHLAELISHIMGFNGKIKWNTSRPDGQLRRSLDISLAEKEFGFKAKTSLINGLKKTIAWYLSQPNEL